MNITKGQTAPPAQLFLQQQVRDRLEYVLCILKHCICGKKTLKVALKQVKGFGGIIQKKASKG